MLGESKAPNTVVVGMGPTGISCALSLLHRGHNVTLIDKREEYSLKQKILITDKIRDRLIEPNFDSGFAKQLQWQFGATSLRDFGEKYFNALRRIVMKDKFFNYKGKKEINGKLTILQGEQYTIIEADGDNQTITLKNKKKYDFDYIIDASGSKRVLASLFAKDKKYQITYDADLLQPEHRFNAVISFKCKTEDAQAMSYLEKDDYTESDFNKFGWNLKKSPIYYLAAINGKNKVYLLTEIPEELYQSKNFKDVIDFVKPILKSKCKTKNIDLVEAKEKIFSTFDLKHEIAAEPYTTLGKKGALIVAGDARCPSNFHFNHGVEKGVKDGFSLLKVFDNNGGFCTTPLFARSIKIREDINHRQEAMQTKNIRSITSSLGIKALTSIIEEKRNESKKLNEIMKIGTKFKIKI